MVGAAIKPECGPYTVKSQHKEPRGSVAVSSRVDFGVARQCLSVRAATSTVSKGGHELEEGALVLWATGTGCIRANGHRQTTRHRGRGKCASRAVVHGRSRVVTKVGARRGWAAFGGRTCRRGKSGHSVARARKRPRFARVRAASRSGNRAAPRARRPGRPNRANCVTLPSG